MGHHKAGRGGPTESLSPLYSNLSSTGKEIKKTAQGYSKATLRANTYLCPVSRPNTLPPRDRRAGTGARPLQAE